MSGELGKRPAAVPFLGAQAFAHGLLCIFTIVPAAGLFLSAYGAKRLPYVYILVAFVGVITAPFFARALGRWSVLSVARPFLVGLVVLHLGCWLVISRWGDEWPAVIVQVLTPITLQFGFVFLGTQAGRVLTMREMKAWFSKVASGFSVALLVGGLLAPVLVDALGATEDLLWITALSACLLLLLISLTHRRFPAELAVAPRPTERPTERPSDRAIPAGPESVRDPVTPTGAPVRKLILLIFAYQVFSALGTQFGEYVLFDRAAARYATSQDLARFASHFNVGLNIVELVFLFLLAGPLLARYGLRFGLFANPMVVLVTFGAALVVAPIAGVGSLALFAAAGATRIGDIVLTNSTTRTATNTAYQALPVNVRPSVQARTEGIAVPAAIGLSGVLLLGLERLGAGITAVIGLSFAVCVAWVIATAALYARYRNQLRENLGHRVLTPYLVPYGDSERGNLIELVLHDELADELPDEFPDMPGSVDGQRTVMTRSQLRNQPAALASILAALNESPVPDPRRIVRYLRQAERHDPRLIDVLIDLASSGSRQVKAAALQRLAMLIEPTDARREPLVAAVIESAISDSTEIVHALKQLPDDGRSGPLRAALLEEIGAVQDCALFGLSLLIGVPPVTRARQWLKGDERQRATAIESIEVNTPGRHRAAIVAIVELERDLALSERRLRGLETTWPDTEDVLIDIRDDPRQIWQEPWLSSCARYALT